MTGAVIAGAVRANSGEPVVEAQVYFAQAPVDVPDVAALTDEGGRFSLYAPGPGEYVIECSAIGFAAGTATVDVAGQEPTIEIEVELVRL